MYPWCGCFLTLISVRLWPLALWYLCFFSLGPSCVLTWGVRWVYVICEAQRTSIGSKIMITVGWLMRPSYTLWLSFHSLSSLGGAPFIWQVKFKFLVRYILQRLFVLLLIFVYEDFFFRKFGCMDILGLVHNFRKMLMMYFQGFFIRCLSIVCRRPLSVLYKLSGLWLTT